MSVYFIIFEMVHLYCLCLHPQSDANYAGIILDVFAHILYSGMVDSGLII